MTDGRARAGDDTYADRLIRLQTAWWKRLLGIQVLFGWNLRRLEPGFTLDVGCGIGRTLLHLGGHGVGIDTNDACVRAARARGLTAFTPAEFHGSEYSRGARFDSLLLAHVAEHMTEEQAGALVREYAAFIRPGGQLILLAPQEAGFRSDPTHVQLMDFTRLTRLATQAGFEVVRIGSFPFPRWAGRWFTYNEFVVVGRRAVSAAILPCPRPS